ncbi:TIGR00730 family Rossman fold protein [Sphingomonas sp. ID0503]|uniref:LOG family protein n=1 Tax=Sphingomonas sp. ID0503 TaxID=3399691 RepID=UPI003AFACBFD
MRSICVFCGSSPGFDPAYRAAAERLGAALAVRDITLVYGGGSVGLMGVVADAALAKGGRVTGVIPDSLAALEVEHRGLTELILTGSMHERKAIMADRADGFIAIPGGIGTLEELFEIWTWAQLGDHAKPVGLLNVAGFYDPLLRFLDHVVRQGFLKIEHRDLLQVESEVGPLLDKLADYVPPVLDKWIDDGER